MAVLERETKKAFKRKCLKAIKLNLMKVLGLEPKTYGLKGRCLENSQSNTSNDISSTYDSGKNELKHLLTPNLTTNRAPEAQIDPDLQGIISAWKDLPEHIRQTIKTIAETAGQK